MSEVISRSLYGSLLLVSLYRSIHSYSFYLIFITSIFLLSLKELYPYYKRSLVKYLILVHVFVFYVSIFELLKNDVLSIIIYNSVSDIFQYIFGKVFGKTKPFSFTNKSMEGYIAGIILTYYLFNFGDFYITLNIFGMIGGLISSLIKRKLGLKHWGNIFGSHGGVNDRIDSIAIPILIFYILK